MNKNKRPVAISATGLEIYSQELAAPGSSEQFGDAASA